MVAPVHRPSVERRGLFIVFEGGEGVGKTTQWQRLAEALRVRQHDVLALREPGGTPAGDEIRRILLEPDSDLNAESEALLFAASRAQLVRAVIAPALARGTIVLVDRFLLSTYAYQGAGRGLSIPALRETNLLATGGMTPDATLLLTMPLGDALARMRARGVEDRMEREGIEFHARVHRAFADASELAWQLRHPEVGPVYQIEALGSPEDVTTRCLHQLSAHFSTQFAGVVDG